MYRVKIAIEKLNRALKQYENNKGENNNESMIELLKEIDNTEYVFHNYIYDILRNFPEIQHRYTLK